MKKKFAYAIATFFGVGYFPIAPGTAGSLITLPIAFYFTYYGNIFAMLAFLAIVYAIGTVASKEVLKYAKHDPSFIVIDEVAGQMIPFLFAPQVFFYIFGILLEPKGWWIFVALPSFILFRVFDIFKPFPASYFDKKVLNAHGVMLDDVAAGIYAFLALVLGYIGLNFITWAGWTAYSFF